MTQISSVYFFPFLNTYKFQYFGKVRRKKQFLSFFSRSLFPRFLFFTGERCSVEFGGKAPVIFCPRFFPLFPGVSATASTHLVTPTAIPELPFFSQARPGSFWHQITRPFTATSVLKTKFFIPISSDEKGTTSSVKASTNPLAPSSSSSSSGRATQ